MKRTRTCIVLAAFGLTCITAGFARAGQEPTPESQDEDGAQEPQTAQVEGDEQKPGAPETPATRTGVPRSGLDPQTRHAVSVVLRLQAAVKKEFDLPKEQEEAIETLFRDYVRELKESQSPRRPFGVDSERTLELKELRKQIAAANEAGDKETVKKLRNEFAKKLREPASPARAEMPRFLDSVASHLDESQRARFRKLAMRFGAASQHPSQLNTDLFLMWRAVAMPDVGATREQRAEIRDIIRDARFALGEAYDDEAKAQEVIRRARQDLMQKLTPEQQAKFQEVLADPYRGAQRTRVQPPSTNKASEEPTGEEAKDDEDKAGGAKDKEPGE
jgi:Spy/CpxP family protein refolding chaperone